MAEKGTVLITGATGNVGSILAPLLRSAGVQVRALVRDEAKAQPLRALGVELAIGDLDDSSSLDGALDGVSQVYLVTWNGPTGATHGHNLIEAALRTGRPHIIKQGGYGSPKSRIIQQHILVNHELERSGLDYTFLEPTFFMQNLMMAGQSVVSDGAIYLPLKDGRVGMVDVRDIADVAAALLTTAGHAGKTYVLTGPQSISVSDVAAALSTTLDKPVRYVDVPLEAAKQAMMGMGVPEWVADGFSELFVEFSINWGDRVSPVYEDIMGRPGRSIAQFAHDFAPVFGGSALAGVAR